MTNKTKLNKDLLLLLAITTFLIIFSAYVIFNALDMFNPILADEEYCLLTPQLENLLKELEQKYR